MRKANTSPQLPFYFYFFFKYWHSATGIRCKFFFSPHSYHAEAVAVTSRAVPCAAFQHGVIHRAPGKQIHRWNFSAAPSVPGPELPVKGRGLRAAPRGGCRRKGAHLPSPHTWTWHRTNWTWSSSHLLPSFIKKQSKKKKSNPSLSCCWKSNSPAPLPILQGADGVSGERRVGGRGEGQEEGDAPLARCRLSPSALGAALSLAAPALAQRLRCARRRLGCLTAGFLKWTSAAFITNGTCQ